MQVRKPAVAGMFYPADAEALRTLLQDYLATAQVRGQAPKAVIVPHAGYQYSGPVAASAYKLLAQARNTVHRIILLGPSHRMPLNGLGLSSAAYFSTPLGNIPVDGEAYAQIRDLPQVQIVDDAHAMEHSLEVHLPFLQIVLDAFRLVPLVVGEASPSEVSEVLERLWNGPETRLVISSDLSHYHDYQTARRLDKATSLAIEGLRYEEIGYEDACGRIPISGLLHLARAHNLRPKVLDLRNSGDTAGLRDQVVGYGAYAFEEPIVTG